MQPKKRTFRKSHQSYYSQLPKIVTFISTNNQKELLRYYRKSPFSRREGETKNWLLEHQTHPTLYPTENGTTEWWTLPVHIKRREGNTREQPNFLQASAYSRDFLKILTSTRQWKGSLHNDCHRNLLSLADEIPDRPSHQQCEPNRKDATGTKCKKCPYTIREFLPGGAGMKWWKELSKSPSLFGNDYQVFTRR